MRIQDILLAAFCILLCQTAGIVGALLTADAVSTWYSTLQKPFLNPPSFVFAPVWTLLYAVMGSSFFLIVKRGIGEVRVRIAAVVFMLQLVLNALWSPIFFALRSPGWALIDLGLMWICIVLTIIAFFRVSRIAAYLLVPYLLWVTFASYLNFGILILN